MGIENFGGQIPQNDNLEKVEDKEKSLNKEELTALLKENAFDLFEVSKQLKEGQNNAWAKDIQVDRKTGETLLKPYTWNENSGVVIFNDGDKTYVRKSSDALRSELFKSIDYTKEEGLGVPGVNNEMAWKSKADFEHFKTKWR